MVKRPVVLEVPLVLDSFYLVSFLQFLLPFSRKRLLLRWIVDIVKGIRSSFEEFCKSRCYFSVGLLSQHLLLCHVMKMCHVCYYNSFRLLMSGKINPNPGPVSASTAGKINCLVMNARSLKRCHKAAQQTGNPCVTSFASRTWCTHKTLTLYASMRHG